MVKLRFSAFLLTPILLLSCTSYYAAAAEHGTIIREAIIYLSPDSSSAKLAQAERGREVVLLDRSRNWVHVEAILGFAHAPDSEFIEDDEAEQKTVTGWILDAGIVWPSTPNGDRIYLAPPLTPKMKPAAAMDAAARTRMRFASTTGFMTFSPRLRSLGRRFTAPPTLNGRSIRPTCNPAHRLMKRKAITARESMKTR